MARARLKLLAQARTDLIELRRYGVRTFGKPAATRYAKDMRSVFGLLRDNPLAGVARSEIGENIRSFSKRSHQIIYLVGEGEVQIVRILHHSRDVRRALSP